MRKKDLLSLPEIKVSNEMKETARLDKPVERTVYRKKYVVYNIKEYYIAKVFNGILVVAIFTRDDILRDKPSYIIYISKDENKYLTYDTIQEKWRTARIDNLNYNYSYFQEKRYYCKGTEKTIVDYLDNEEKTGYEAILCFQLKIKKEQLRKAHRRITDKIDSAMELVPELPKGFYQWVEDVVMAHSRYIYYVYSRKVKEGYCTHCKSIVTINKPKHNTKGICSKCRSKITFKAVKKAAFVCDEGYASIFQKTKKGYIYRYFEISKVYRDYEQPELKIHEAVRKLFDKDFNVTGEYEWAEFRNTGVYRWCIWEQKVWSYSGLQSNNRYVYPSSLYDRNLKQIFKGTEYQYSAIDLLAKGLKGAQFYPLKYLDNYRHNKFLEYMVKLKLYRLVKDYLDRYHTNILNEHGKRIHEVLRVPKEQIKLLAEMNASMEDLRVLQKANEAGVKLTKEQIRWIAENRCSALIDYIRFSTAHKVIRYLKDQSAKEKMQINNVAVDYYDYLDTAEKLGYNLRKEFVFFPRHLKQSHDITIDEWKQKKEAIEKMQDDERNIEMAKIAEELIKKYSMKDKHFTIRVPWTCEEIRNEGHALHHCVGTYLNRVLTKETAILFIRKNEDINSSFYTMEIKNNSVEQVRGKYNCSPTPEVERFVEKFVRKKLQRQLDKEAV